MAFSADLVMGIIVPTFSLFATSLGASLALVGALTGMSGLTSIVVAVPIGVLSDQRGRKVIIVAGMALFSLSSLLYTVVPSPLWLFPVRVVGSLGLAAVFMIGVAYIGDITTRSERGLALGLYSTAMALGFTIGPALGGLVAERYGYAASYRVAALIALIGLVVALRGLVGDRPSDTRHAQANTAAGKTTGFRQKLRLMVSQSDMLAASLANLGNNIVFTTVFSFVPLYAATLGIGEATLGTMFALRGLASAAARIPTGLMADRISGRILMIGGLCSAVVIMVTLALSRAPLLITVLLIADGIAYGLFLTAGQTHVTALAAEGDRGRAMGIYTMAGSIGSAAGPVLMGIVAEWFGLAIVFPIAAVVALVAAINLWASGRRSAKSLPVPLPTEL
ncbi:MAG: MFS transporter [Caldilineaceae bacterium]